MPKTDIERLRLLTDQLELIRELLATNLDIQAKAAIILLDSLTDSLMYDACLQEFDRQSALASIQRPRYDPERREKIRRDFRQKLSVARDSDLVSEQDATVLRIGHSYRNAAYHRDSHNPRVSGLLGRILLSSTAQLFAEYFDNGRSVGGIHEGWLETYGIKSTFFSFKGASSAIAKKGGLTLSGCEIPSRRCMAVRVPSQRPRG